MSTNRTGNNHLPSSIVSAGRRGFATITALVALSLVGVTVAGLMRHFSIETVRTREETDRAQLHQMVIAGSLGKPASPVALPDDLTKSGGKLVLRFGPNDTVVVEAEIDKRHERWAGLESDRR